MDSETITFCPNRLNTPNRFNNKKKKLMVDFIYINSKNQWLNIIKNVPIISQLFNSCLVSLYGFVLSIFPEQVQNLDGTLKSHIKLN